MAFSSLRDVFAHLYSEEDVLTFARKSALLFHPLTVQRLVEIVGINQILYWEEDDLTEETSESYSYEKETDKTIPPGQVFNLTSLAGVLSSIVTEENLLSFASKSELMNHPLVRLRYEQLQEGLSVTIDEDFVNSVIKDIDSSATIHLPSNEQFHIEFDEIFNFSLEDETHFHAQVNNKGQDNTTLENTSHLPTVMDSPFATSNLPGLDTDCFLGIGADLFLDEPLHTTTNGSELEFPTQEFNLLSPPGFSTNQDEVQD